MLSTMQDLPLNLSRILTYGATVFADCKVTTWESGAMQETTFAEIAARAAALAHALHGLGITGDQRVATLMFNCAEHVETFFAVACKGAVFNPLNKQLMNDQIAHIINHAEDEVIICDQRLAKQLGAILALGCPTVKTVVFIGRADISAAARFIPDPITCVSYETLLDGQSTVYHWPVLEETTAAALCYSTGTAGAPKGVAYSHRSIYLQVLSLRTTDSMAIETGQSFLCCVPIYHVLSWFVPIAAFMSGAPWCSPARTCPRRGWRA